MIIAFDWDGTLSTRRLQVFVKRLMREKHEIWIVTARRENNFSKKEIETIINRMGLTGYNVMYCDDKPKWEYLVMINADLYIDNISDEFETILNHTTTIPLLYAAN